MSARTVRILAVVLVVCALAAGALRVAGQQPAPTEWVVFMEQGLSDAPAQVLGTGTARGVEVVGSIPAFDAYVVRATAADTRLLRSQAGVRDIVPNIQFKVGPGVVSAQDEDGLAVQASATTRVTPGMDIGPVALGGRSTFQLRITNVGTTFLRDLSLTLAVREAPEGMVLTTDAPGPNEYRLEWLLPGASEWAPLGEGNTALPSDLTVLVAGQRVIPLRVTLGAPGALGSFTVDHRVDASSGGEVDLGNVADVPWHIAAVRADRAWPHTRGAGVKVAVVDTGIDDRWGELAVAGGCNAVEQTSCVDGGWADQHGHGTGVAGFIAANPDTGHLRLTGVAPEAALYAVRVCDDAGLCSLADVLRGLAWAEASGMQVVNMSIGALISNPDVSGPVCAAMTRAADSGMVLVAASGNEGESGVTYPAACADVVAVGALDADNALWNVSSSVGSGRGPEMMSSGLVAPGDQVFRLRRFNVVPDAPPPGSPFSHGVAVSTGTSFAAPIVAGAAALLLAGGRSHEEVFDILAGSALDLGLPEEQQGAGLVNVHRAWVMSQE